ncbi:MAG: DUF748 domain-containing protein [Gammaproteobacteria bacterium]
MSEETTTDKEEGSEPATGFLYRHRRLLIGVVVAVALYALAGFFLAPWLIERQAVKTVAEQFDSELRLGEVAVNPFVLSLRIDGLELDDPTGEALARIRQIFVNFQTSSLFRWAFTFDEFRVDEPELFVSRDGEGRFNFERMLAAQPPAPPEEPADEEDAGPVRLIVRDFAINESAVNWRDQVPREPVEQRFGPVDISVQDLNTLPLRPGTQEVVIRTATEGTLTWSGSLQLNPLGSAGTAAIDGSHFALLSSYIRYQTGFDITDGDADVDLAYTVSTADDGTITATVDDLNVTLQGVRVRTFPTDAAATEEAREFLTVPRLAVTGGVFRWPERSVSVGGVDIDDVALDLLREPDGVLDILPGAAAAETGVDGGSDPGAEAGTPAEAQPDADDGAAPGDDAWRVTLDRFAVNNLSAQLRDESVQPVAETSVAAVNLEVRNITNEPGASFPTTLSLQAGRGGTVSADGEMTVLPEPLLDFTVGMEDVALIGLQPYVEPLADVNFDSGDLNMQIRLQSTADDPARIEGDVSIDDFLVTETDLDTRIGSWERLALASVIFSMAEEKLEISEVRFTRPYGDILITEEGQVNLGRLAKDPAAGTTDAADAGANAGEAESSGGEEAAAPVGEAGEADVEEEAGLPIRISVGRVLIEDASADFADRSLPLPFEVAISKLKGELSTIDTTSDEPSRVAAEGTVDEFGFLRVTGSVTPFEPARNTDLRAEFENVAMPKFSAYSVPFAGRKIASGRLDLDLGYQVSEGRLVGENSIVLREFELGEKVPHPDALSLPLGLAVALLKDSSGTIDVDLPVRGDINNPEFSIGGIVIKAITNLITKIVTAPFALLGNLLGVEASQLEGVSFLPGRADLTPPQMETAANLSQALVMRPQLVLVLPPVQAPEVDGRALREAQLESLIAERIEGTVPQGEQAMYDEQVRSVLEMLYGEIAPVPDAAVALDELRARHTVQPAEGSDEEPRFDALAYTNDLREQLIELQTLEPGALETLARQRAEGLRETIIAAGTAIENRVRVGEPTSVDAEDGERVVMKVKLTAGNVPPPAAAQSATSP